MLYWIANKYSGITDALRVMSYLMLKDGWLDHLTHFPYTRGNVEKCIKTEREKLIKMYSSPESKNSFSAGLICLIKLCRCHREGIMDEIKGYFSRGTISANELTAYYIGCLHALIDEFEFLNEKDQDQQIRLVCGLCSQTKLHKEFSNARTIAWLIECVSI